MIDFLMFICVWVVIFLFAKVLNKTKGNINLNELMNQKNIKVNPSLQNLQHAFENWTKSLYEAEKEEEYDHALLDYCDSDVPSSPGISFRQLREGTDELAYLAAYNRKREKMLERSLEEKRASS